MITYKVTCPCCATRLKTAKPLLAAKGIKCPKCGACLPAASAASIHPALRRPNVFLQLPPSRNQNLLSSEDRDQGRNGPLALQKSSKDVRKKKGNPVLVVSLVGSATVFLVVGLGMLLGRGTAAVPDDTATPKMLEHGSPGDSATAVETAEKPPTSVDRLKQAGGDSANRQRPAGSEQQANEDGVKVLIPGEPRLTQDFLDHLTAYAEWLLDIRLTEQQRRECQQLWVKGWKEADQSMKNRFWDYASTELQRAREVEKLTDAERDELRVQRQPLFVASLRKSSGQEDRMLLELFDSAHQPGGERNPILAAGTPPLAQEMVDTWRMFVEWILDVRLTEQERQEFQRLFIIDWNELDQAAKDNSFTSITEGLPSQLPLLNNYYRNLLRAQRQPQFLAALKKSSTRQLSRWLLAVYDSAHKHGGERNQVHVPGTPPLTQDMVSQYGDFIEWVLGLKLSGGLTGPQRRDLREVLMSDWKTMDKSGKDSFVRLLKRWNAIVQLSDTERNRNHEELHTRFLAQLRSSPDNEPSRWLLAIYSNEQELVRCSTNDRQTQTDSTKKLIEGNLGDKPQDP